MSGKKPTAEASSPAAAAERVASTTVPPDFQKVDLNKTEWVIPKKYTNPSPVGSGAYGQVW